MLRVSDPTPLHTYRGAALDRLPDGGAWVAWCFDEIDGPEGGIRLRHVDASGVLDSNEVLVARGTRGGFELGDVVALSDGGAAVAWRGDEGMAWVAAIGPNGRTRKVSFLDACESAPVIARGSGDAVLAAFARPDATGVLMLSALAGGELKRISEGPPGSMAPAIARSAAGTALAYRAGSGIEFAGESGITRIAMPNARMVPHALALAASDDHWVCAWVGEDTGRLSMHAVRVGGEPVRIADVWAPLERPRASAPALCASGAGGFLLAWREERGPRPGVYLRALDGEARQHGSEIRVSTRGAIASAGRVGLVSDTGGGWMCAFVERDDQGEAVCLAKG